MKNQLQGDETNLSPEQQILIHSARLELDDIAASGIKTIILNNPDWQEILTLSEQYGIQPLLNKHLSKDDFSGNVPEHVLTALTEKVSRLSMKCLLIHSELSLFLEAVIQENIPVILLKGSFLAENIYRDISLRPMMDIDILCKEEDINKIHNLLLINGYSQPPSVKHKAIEKFGCHLPQYIHPNGAIIEVHSHIFPQLKFSENHINNIWKNVLPCKNFASPVYSLSHEDLLFFLVIHLYKHLTDIQGITLCWLCDIHEVIQHIGSKINWDRFFEHTDSLYTMEAVSSVLRLIQTNWRTQIPETAAKRIKYPARKIPLNKIFSSKIDASKYYAKRFKYLWEIKGLQNKIKFCFVTFFPTRDYIKHKYHLDEHSFIFFYYLRHPFDILWKASKRLILHKN